MPKDRPDPVKFQEAPKRKNQRTQRFKDSESLPKLPVVSVETLEQEEEVYYSNQKNDQLIKIVYPKAGKGHTPRLPMARREFRKLCQFLPRVTDLASWFRVDEKTLNTWAHNAFPEIPFKNVTQLIAQLGSAYTFGLRRFLWGHAERSPNAAIFLAKNYLSLRDAPQDEAASLQVETINYQFPKTNTDVQHWKGPVQHVEAEIIEHAITHTNGTSPEATVVRDLNEPAS